MQHSDERPPTSGRPSLLSLDQQAEADRHRILSGLESTSSATTTGGEKKSRRGMYTWLAAGAAVLALGGGAGLWLMSEGEKEIVAAGSAPLPATPAPAAALASEAPPVRGTAEDVPAAAILNETPASKAEAAGGKKHADDELAKMLEHGMPAAPATGAAVPPAVVAKEGAATPAHPLAAAHAAKPTHPLAKTAVKKPLGPHAQASNIAPHPHAAANAAAKKKVEAKPAVPVDNDVALLAALVAHAKATQPKVGTGVAAKLKQCKSLDSAAEASQCRARICAGAKNEAECKS